VGNGVNAAKRMNKKRKEAGPKSPQSEVIGKKAGRVVGNGVNAAKRMNKKRKEADHE
jgi:hypothetical protein